MKKILLFLFTVLLFISYAQTQNALLPSKLVMYDRIQFDTIPEYLIQDQYFNFRSSIYTKQENSQDIDVNGLLVKKLSNGEINAYSDYTYYLPGKIESSVVNSDHRVVLTPMEVKSNLGYSVDSVDFYDENIGEYKIIEVIKEIDKNSIQGFVFYDEWIFDEQNFKMTKIVKAYSPIRVFFRENDWGDNLQPLFKTVGFIIQSDVQNEKEKSLIDKNMKLFKKVEYEFLLENTDVLMFKSEMIDPISNYIENQNSPLWNSYTREKFINMIFERVLAGKSETFDFNTGNKITTDEIRSRAGERIDTIMVMDPENPDLLYDALVKTEISSVINQIKSVIFLEEWYIDEKSLRIKKAVKGLVPVRWYYEEEDFEQLNPIKIKLFKVNFNQ